MRTFLKFNLFLLFTIILIISPGCKKAPSGEKNLIDVEVEKVKPAELNQEISYSGTIEESEKIPLTFAVYGTVAKVFVSEGDYVKKGQLLAVLDSENYQNTFDLTMATQKQAEDAYNRLLPMYKKGNIPEIKLVEVETNLKKAKAQAAIAKKNFKDCSLYSTLSGIVGKRRIDPGMTSTPNVTSIEIIKIDTVFAVVSVTENEISLIKKEMKAQIKIGALGDKKITGIVHEIGVMADPLAHTFKVKITISNSDRVIKPGMICDVIIEKKNKNYGFVVQSRAVMEDDSGRNYVYVVTDSQKVEKKYVKIGNLVNEGIEIADGLKNDDMVVVSGQHKLVDNSLVNIVNR